MAETLISPGVFAIENDQTQITQGPIAAGAAIIGPTVKGPVNVPTRVTSFSEYKAKFGTAFISGGATLDYLTSIAAQGYFQQGGTSLLVTRVGSGSYTSATVSVPSISSLTAGGAASASINLTNILANSGSVIVNGITFQFTTSSQANTATTVYVPTGSNTAGNYAQLTASINAAATQSAYGYNLSAGTGTSPNLNVTASVKGTGGNFYYITSGSTTTYLAGGTDISAFTLETLSVGTVMNNNSGTTPGGGVSNGILPSGSNENIRYEIVASNSGSGFFTLNIRRGDDYQNNKTILETWSNLSLDPNQSNYIAYVIGDQAVNPIQDPTTGNYYLQTAGSYTNNSMYVRVKSVDLPTPGYMNAAGQPIAQYTASLPQVGSGSYQGTFSGATGAIWGSYGVEALNMYTNIPNVASSTTVPNTNIQGLHPTDYDVAINLLGNRDSYDFNAIFAPGLTNQNATAEITALINLAQNRGDNIAVIDTVGYGQNIGTVVNQANSFDSSYAATYWPWVQVRSNETGKVNFVPASTMIPAVYEYNDKVSVEWFAPAGFTRGGMATVIQPERRLSIDDRNTLYAASVNPIANFPGVGTVIYGQKTLQNAASALDKVNVRRLLISLKRYITQVANQLVFDPNTQVLWNKFLTQVNPYLTTVQQRQGLYSFHVVMDETNNTPSVIDRNEVVGAIYLQPTRTAEFIYLTFNLTPTGVAFKA